MINTKDPHVARRPLRFTKIDDALADVERCIASERDGTLTRTGNWTVGQTFGHLAGWIIYTYDGYPKDFRTPPFPVRALARVFRSSILNRPFSPGFRVKGASSGTFSVEPLSAEDGYTRLKRELIRLRHEEPRRASPVFGRMTHEEWIKLHLRHCELHLSFLHPA